MAKFSMKHLRYFEALARHGHFRKAAEDCAITQPALSMQIRELEGIVGAPLVERSARQVRLTALGEDFAERARGILRAVDELDDLVRSTTVSMVGKLRLGIIPTIAPYLLPQVIQALSAKFPGIDLRPRETVTKTLIEDLIECRIDMAILALPISEPSLREIELFREEFVLVRPLQDSDKPIPNSEKLREMRLLLLEEGHCFRDQALSFCSIGDEAPSEMMEGSSLTTLVQMVGTGIGVTLIPEMAVPIETRSSSVSVAQLAEPRPSRTVGLVWRKSSPLEKQFMQVAEVVKEAGLRRLQAS
ncbi:hydrogen peroxide-inducible genes activator [Rhodobacteraceae bacterium RKSG542]|uniref:hydrogen peroxide-inducible genes activator n=1 Tax=Pseudovibrio flavus TaxID=2529854 RepID=UPI0012BC7F2A|nr:hydrogen peroxide-inducible genes activator [Pseudovibrio flavus]MTI18156.1 hydrogen peroxide-inducible genes activator [Pseudovibrio flavus]